MIDLRTTLLWLVKATLVCLGAMISAAVVYVGASLLFSSHFRQSLLWDVGWASMPPLSYEAGKGPDLKIVMPIYQSHGSIVRWILGCGNISINNLDGSARFSVSWYPDGNYASATKDQLEHLPPGSRLPVRQEWAVVQLSKSLADLRYQSQEKAESSYLFWQVSTLVTIALGMITTILVSLSSTEFGRDGAPAARTIRLLAIAFPALGTAAAAAVAFYGPQTTWTQANRTLASATQLHGKMGLDIWRLQCIAASASPDNAAAAARERANVDALEKQLADWEKQYTDIVALASAAGQSPSGASGDTGGGQGHAPGPAGGSGGGQGGGGNAPPTPAPQK